jgi:hypothetical protein
MKYLVLLAALIALPAMAQQRPELTPEQKWNAANAVSAVAIGWFVLPAAIVTGKREGLCKLMGGKYDLSAADQCAGGQWANVALFLKEQKQ